MNVIIWLDAGLQVERISLIYLNVLLSVGALLFFIWRYRKETAYFKALKNLLDSDRTALSFHLPASTFHREELINHVFRSLTISYEKKLAKIEENNLLESEYIAAWVHEVKAPLTAMKMILDAHRNLKELRGIESEWLRIHLLIDQQLSMTRLATIETDYLPERKNLQAILAAEVKDLATWCLEKNIAVEFEGETLEVLTDEKWCRFIVRQLLTNAVKYSPLGGMIRIIINQTELGNVTVAIQDEGAGIEGHDIRRIFNKGFTGGAGRIHNEATGLGLYLAKRVADQIGIVLGVMSEKGKGARFSMTFTRENDYQLTGK